ncbi:MAG: alpha/beta hydrolase-fold protein [Bacteroidota bacterium]
MRLLLLALLLFIVTPALAQQSIVDQFERRSLTRDGLTVPYRLFVPADYDSAQAYPLVLALHGAGERGDDNERQIRPHRLATSWADPVNQARRPAFVVAPQVPRDARWTADAPPSTTAFNDVQLATLAILDSLEVEFNIDLDRVYVVGLSMGGHGVWDFISRRPERFAAAVPMSGIGYAEAAEDIRHIPIWAFHGESDTVVRVQGSRGPIHALEDLGRDVFYTECRRAPSTTAANFDCPTALPDSVVRSAIDARADLLYTGVERGGHGPWTVWFDDPLMAPWLFQQVRVDPEALLLTAPAEEAASGEVAVTWTASAEVLDTVEVWYSTDAGANYALAGTAPANAGTFMLDTVTFPDAIFAKVRLVGLDAEGFVRGRAVSSLFAVDNPGNASPLLEINDATLRFNPTYTADVVTLPVIAADPEGQPLTLTVRYSTDGLTFMEVETRSLSSSTEPQDVEINVAALSNGADAVFAFDLSDGTATTSARTTLFDKETPRDTNDFVQQVEGTGTGTVIMHFIEPENLTGHRYRLTIDDTDFLAKTYTVTDLDENEVVLTDVPFSDGITESPLFDGMRLIVQDLVGRGPDLEETGWTNSESTLGVSIAGDEAFLALQVIPMLATEDVYSLTIAEEVVDTSAALFRVNPVPVRFTVTAESDGLPRAVLFRDGNRNGLPERNDILHILEPGPDDALAPAWEFRFSSNSSTVLPEPGAVFRFVPIRSLRASDVFEFTAAVGVAVEDRPRLVPGVHLVSYPNPFREDATVAYRLEAPAAVTIEVYDLLGRRIARLMDRVATLPGSHRVTWATDAPAGVYVVRLTAASGATVVRQQQMVVRVR